MRTRDPARAGAVRRQDSETRQIDFKLKIENLGIQSYDYVSREPGPVSLLTESNGNILTRPAIQVLRLGRQPRNFSQIQVNKTCLYYYYPWDRFARSRSKTSFFDLFM